SDGGGLTAFCGSPFWNESLTWETDNPDLTPCFEHTVLVWVPCIILWILAPLETKYILDSVDRLIPWSWVNISKGVASIILLLVELIEFCYAIYKYASDIPVYTADFLKPALLFVTIFLQLALVYVGKKRGIQSSGVLFIFWFLLMFFSIPEYRSLFIDISNQETETDLVIFSLYMIYFPVLAITFLINCFGDSRPQHVDYPRGEKACPELDASFLSRITFAWVDRLIWNGHKQPLQQSDMWDLSYENASSTVVNSWEKNWSKTKAKAVKKGESHTSATYSNNAATLELSGKTAKGDHYLSILPTMIRSFGPSFAFGALLKLFHDCLQFLSPLILKKIIDFATNKESGDEPMWRGVMYALFLLMCTQVQSLVLGQYFSKMFLIGLRIRTGVISAVYQKSLRISNSARKESTVGEIVNLMSVDAQRFMDLTTYINMLWSAPLQIILAIYFLWQILGPSVLAGLAVMVVLIPVNGFIANKVKTLQIKQMKNKDQRVKLMNEILNGIKVLKLYAWEPSFESNITDVRNKEIKVLRQSAYLNAGTSFIWTCTPFLVLFCSLTTYILVDDSHTLTSEKIFVSVALLNILRVPLGLLPIIISITVQANVSLGRMNKFMNADELDPNAISKDTTANDPITVENGTFAWGHDKDDKDVLKNININIKNGSLVAVVGKVGTGKSSLCSAVLGEMEKKTGRVTVKGSVAYVSQLPWIQNSTLQENITFNKEHDPCFYNSVVDACALRPDLDMLPGGDQTEIGEKGINLSGGQKQRVSVARAVYNDADIYLLDDPLSAVDAHVGKHIFEKVFGPQGILKHKTRIMVTHGLTYLPHMDKIIVLKDGEISEEGSYQELIKAKGEFQDFLLQHLAEENAEDDQDLQELVELKNQLEDSLGKDAVMKEISRTKKESESEKDNCRRDGSLRRRGSKKISESGTIGDKKSKPGEKLVEAEKSETGKVSSSVYSYYMRAIGMLSSFLTMFFYAASQGCTVGSNIWLSRWSDANITVNGTQDHGARDMYLGVYGAMGIGQALFILGGAFSLSIGGLEAASTLHNHLLKNVMRMPMAFFDTNPVGRIINRFAKDVDTLDNTLPWNVRSWLMCFFTVMSTFAVIIFATPWFVVVMVPTMVIYYFVQLLQTNVLLENLSQNLVIRAGHLIKRASTIRAYNQERTFILSSEKKVDFNQVSYYPSTMANRWLAVRLEFIGNIMTFFAALFAVMAPISAGTVGLSVSYAMSVTQTLNWLVRMTSDVETNIVAVERVKEYTETPQEAAWEVPEKKPQKDWPEKGVVKFNKYSTRYREGLDLVVKNIDIEIQAGEKVGIVGRTGAGKSSLTLALFRIIESAGGNITIDGVDISKIGLHDVRGRLTIIPQDPVLFSGTLRMNLDPFNSYSDEKIWSALEHSHLKSFVKGLNDGLQHEITEGGDNLSVGQRQLVCLARALLRKTRVLILDEATAAVDLETDDLIQATIRTEFIDCTVLTIAHRLNTIMDSTRVLVLDKGEVREFDTPSVLLKNKESIFYGMAKDAGLVQR
ncbi:unnamed protein product, partial [Meganyctiphanes norvegica]